MVSAPSFPKVALRRLFSVVNGATPDSQNESLWGGRIPWATPEDLSGRDDIRLRETKRTITKAGYDSCGTTMVPPGSLVLSTRAPIGNLAVADVPLCTNQGCRALVPLQELSTRFFYYQLSVQTGALNRLGRGTTFLELSSSELAAFKVHAPERSEQERIANFLDEQTARIDALIAEKQALLAALQEHQYSHSSQLMTRGLEANVRLKPTSHPEIGDVPAHWTIKRLKFLGEVRSGVAKGKDHGERDTVSVPYLRVANVQDGYLDLTEVLEIEVGAHEVERYLLRKNDVLMNEGGDNDKLGRGTVWQGQIDPCVHQNHVFAVRLFDSSLAQWVARFTSTHAARAYFYLRSKQSTNLASINQANVRELPIPMPPEDERKRILEELERSLRASADLRKHVEDHISRLGQYRRSLIAAAVTGELNVA